MPMDIIDDISYSRLFLYLVEEGHKLAVVKMVVKERANYNIKFHCPKFWRKDVHRQQFNTRKLRKVCLRGTDNIWIGINAH